MAATIQSVKKLSQDLVIYIATHLKRPDVAENLRNWNYAAICRELDVISNLLNSKQKQINALKTEIAKGKSEFKQLEDKLNQESTINRQAKFLKETADNNKKIAFEMYEDREKQPLSKIAVLQGDCKQYHAECQSHKAKLNSKQMEIQKLQQEIALKKSAMKQEIAVVEKLREKLKQMEENKNAFKETALELQHRLQASATANKHLEQKVQKHQVKLKNQKKGINPVTYESMFDEQG